MKSSEPNNSSKPSRRGPGVFRKRSSQRPSTVLPHNDEVQSQSGKEFVINVLDFLVRRKWLILSIWLFVTALVAAYTFTRVSEYAASSFIMVDLEGRMVRTAETDPVTERDVFARNDRLLYDELFLLQTSHTIAERVTQRLAEIDSAEAQQTPLQQSQEGLSFRNGYVTFSTAGANVSNSIRVTAISTNASDAALLANLYAEEYVRLTREASRAYITTSRQFLEEQEAKRRDELRQVQEQLEDYLQNGAIGLDQRMSSIITQIAASEVQLDKARSELQSHRVSQQLLNQQLEEISPQLVQNVASGTEQRIQAFLEKIAELESKKTEALLRYPNLEEREAVLLPINQQLQQLYQWVEGLSETYVNELTSTGSSSRPETGLSYITELKRKAAQDEISIQQLTTTITFQEERLNAYRAELNEIPGQSAELAQLELSKEQALQMYQSVVARLQETRIEEESVPGYAHIIRTAQVPVVPARPNKPFYLGFGIFCGLLIGIGLALTRDRLDNRIYKVEQLDERGYRSIGVIPTMRPLIKAQHKGKAMVKDGKRRLATSLVSLLNPMHTVTEAYRHLRTNIQFSLPNAVVQSILVTSPNEGEGKSVTAANLAIVMAQADRRTLLIDADLRRPQVHHLLDLPFAPGLVQFLNGEAGPNVEKLDVEKLYTGIENLYAIPAGLVVSNSSELLGSRMMRDLLEKLRDRFDVIIIDTPPVQVMTDAVLLSTQCDATVLVVRAGKTKEAELDDAIDKLGTVGATVIGLVLNDFDVSKAFGHTYKYGQYSQYGPYLEPGSKASLTGIRRTISLNK